MAGSRPDVREPYAAAVLDRLGGREKVIRLLSAAVICGVVAWIVSESAFWIYIYVFSQTTSPSATNWVTWAQVFSRVAYDVWLGALALLLLIWLTERLRDTAGPKG